MSPIRTWSAVRLLSGLVLVGVLWGCAMQKQESASPRPPQVDQPAPETEQIEALAGRQKQMFSELLDAAAESTPHCERRCGLVQQICELSEHICVIAQKHVEEEGRDYAASCRESQARCERARAQGLQGCECK